MAGAPTVALAELFRFTAQGNELQVWQPHLVVVAERALRVR